MELVEADVADAIELPPGVGDDFGLVSLTELASAVGAEAAVAENHGPAEEDMLMEQDHQQEQDQEQEEEEMHRQREGDMEADQGGEIIHGEGNEFGALSQGAGRGAGASEVKSNDDSTELLLTRRKVMEQAKELLELAEELEQSQDYASLCEQRICELRPGHPIPVTRSCLGVAATPALARSRGTVETRGTPSHILSEKARSKRHALDAAASHNKLEKQFRASQAKLREAYTQLQRLRKAVEKKERERSFLEKKSEQLESQVNDLLVQTQQQSQNQQDHQHMQTSGLTGSRSSSRPISSLAHPAATLPGQVVVLEKRLASSEGEREALAESLANETRTNEEQRVYIAVLEDALKSKAGELGLSDEAQVFAELAKLRSDAEQHAMEAERTRNTNRALQTEIADVRKEAKRASEIAAEESEKALKLSKMIEESSSSLEKIAELEAEKQVLVDYVNQNLQQVAELQEAKDLITAELERVQRAADAARAEQTSTREAMAAMREEMENIEHAEKTALDKVLGLEERLDVTESNLNAKAKEVESLGTRLKESGIVQEELLATIREKKARLETSDREITILHDSLENLKQQLASTKEESLQWQTKFDKSNQDLQATQSYCEALDKTNSELGTSLAEANGRLEEKDLMVAELKASKEEQRQRLEDLQQHEAELEDGVTKLRETCDTMAAGLRELNQVRSQLAEVANEVEAAAASGGSGDAQNDHFFADGKWITSPALRATIPALSVRVREMYQFIQGSIARQVEDAAEIHGLKSDFDSLVAELKETAEKLQTSLENESAAQEKIQELRQVIKTQESEGAAKLLKQKAESDAAAFQLRHSEQAMRGNLEASTALNTRLTEEKRLAEARSRELSTELSMVSSKLKESQSMLANSQESMEKDKRMLMERVAGLQTEAEAQKAREVELIQIAEHREILGKRDALELKGAHEAAALAENGFIRLNSEIDRCTRQAAHTVSEITARYAPTIEPVRQFLAGISYAAAHENTPKSLDDPLDQSVFSAARTAGLSSPASKALSNVSHKTTMLRTEMSNLTRLAEVLAPHTEALGLQVAKLEEENLSLRTDSSRAAMLETENTKLRHQASNAANLRLELDEANARIDAQAKRFLSEKERMSSTINDLRAEMVDAQITSRREATRGEKLDREIALTRQILRDQEERAKAAADRASVLESEIQNVRSDALASKAAAAELGEVARAKEAELSAVDRELRSAHEQALHSALEAQKSKDAAEKYKAQVKSAEVSIAELSTEAGVLRTALLTTEEEKIKAARKAAEERARLEAARMDLLQVSQQRSMLEKQVVGLARSVAGSGSSSSRGSRTSAFSAQSVKDSLSTAKSALARLKSLEDSAISKLRTPAKLGNATSASLGDGAVIAAPTTSTSAEAATIPTIERSGPIKAHVHFSRKGSIDIQSGANNTIDLSTIGGPSLKVEGTGSHVRMHRTGSIDVEASQGGRVHVERTTPALIRRPPSPAAMRLEERLSKIKSQFSAMRKQRSRT